MQERRDSGKEKKHRVKVVTIKRIGHKKEGPCRRHLCVCLTSKAKEGNNRLELTKHWGDFICVRG